MVNAMGEMSPGHIDCRFQSPVRGQLVLCDLEARKPLGTLNPGLKGTQPGVIRKSEVNSVELRLLLLLIITTTIGCVFKI